MKRWQQDLITTLVALEEQIKADSSEYLRLIRVPAGVAVSSADPKIVKLRSRIQNMRRQVIILKRHLHEARETDGTFSLCLRSQT